MLSKLKTQDVFRKNIKTEIAAGRPVKQAVAIAYSIKNKKGKSKKRGKS